MREEKREQREREESEREREERNIRVRRKEPPPAIEEVLEVVESVGGIMCVRDVSHKSVITDEYEFVTNPIVPQQSMAVENNCNNCTSSEQGRNDADYIGYYGIDCLYTDVPSSEYVLGGYRVADENTEEERLLRLEAQTRLCRSEFGAGYGRANAIRHAEAKKPAPTPNDRYLYECGYDVTMAIEHELPPEADYENQSVVSLPPPPPPLAPTETYENSLELVCGHTVFDCGFTPFNCVAHPLPEEIVDEGLQWADVDFTNWERNARDGMDELEYQEMFALWEHDSLEYNAWWPEARGGYGSLWIPGLWDHRNDYGQSAKHLRQLRNKEAAKIKLWKRMVKFAGSIGIKSKSIVRLENSTVKSSRFLQTWAHRYLLNNPNCTKNTYMFGIFRGKHTEDDEDDEEDEEDEKKPETPPSDRPLRWRALRKEARAQRRNINMNYERHTFGSLNKRAEVARAMLAKFYEQKEHKAKRDRLVPKPLPVKDKDEIRVVNPPRPGVFFPQHSDSDDDDDECAINYREMLCPLEFMQAPHFSQQEVFSKLHGVESLRVLMRDPPHHHLPEVDPQVGNLLLAAIRLEAQRGRRSFDKYSRRDHDRVVRLYKKFLYKDHPIFIPRAPRKVVPFKKPGDKPKSTKASKEKANIDAGFTKGGANVIDLNFDLMDESENTFSLKAEKLKTGIVYMLQRCVEYDARVLPDEAWLLEKMMGEWLNEGFGEEGQRRNRCWEYVTMPVPRLASERELNPGDGRDEGHAGFTPADFANMSEAQQARLTLPEILSLRLYTGPAYTILQQSCRREGSEFQVTLLCLEMAIVKLGSKNREQFSVFRGVKGQMPAEFQGAYFQDRQLAIADKAFISATRDLSVALGPKYGGNIVYVFRCGAPQHAEITMDGWLKGGADVAWISQFPDEQEVLFPRYTELLPFPKAKRLQGFTDVMKQEIAASGVELYEFEPTYHYNDRHVCPNLPGLRG